jgi:hypothetical protein
MPAMMGMIVRTKAIILPMLTANTAWRWTSRLVRISWFRASSRNSLPSLV